MNVIYMSKYETNEDVVNLAKVLALGIVVFLFIALVLSGLATIVAPGASISIEANGLIATWAQFLAILVVTYALLLILGKDDSNVMRVVTAFYFLYVLAFLVTKI